MCRLGSRTESRILQAFGVYGVEIRVSSGAQSIPGRSSG